MGYEIGKHICKYRKLRNISQKALAEKIGVTSSRVSNWEQGINRPDVDFLTDICKALEVSPSELLNIKLSDDEFTERERSIIMSYRNHTELQHAVNILLGLDTIN